MERERMKYAILATMLLLIVALYSLQLRAQGNIFNEGYEQPVATQSNGSGISPFSTTVGSPFGTDISKPLFARPDEEGYGQKIDGVTATGGWWVLIVLCVAYALFVRITRKKAEFER